LTGPRESTTVTAAAASRGAGGRPRGLADAVSWERAVGRV